MSRLLPLLLLSTSALAHPLGRDEYSLRAGIEADGDGLRVVVMGEIPVSDVILGLGKLAGGKPPTKAHQSEWTQARLQELGAGQSLSIDGTPYVATWTPSRSALNGRAIDGFFVYVVEARIPASALDHDVDVVLDDRAWMERPMVFSNQVRARDGWSVASTTAESEWNADASQRRIQARFTKP